MCSETTSSVANRLVAKRLCSETTVNPLEHPRQRALHSCLCEEIDGCDRLGTEDPLGLTCSLTLYPALFLFHDQSFFLSNKLAQANTVSSNDFCCTRNRIVTQYFSRGSHTQWIQTLQSKYSRALQKMCK